MLDRLVDDDIRERVARFDLEPNEFGYDRWGASPRDAERMLGLVRILHRNYFRAQVVGTQNVPAGRALLVGNHSGQMAYDGMEVAAAMALDAEPPRFVRTMIERFFIEVPFVNTLMTRTGQLTGLPKNCERLLTDDEAAVMVFPEGERGGGRVWKDRYKIMGFGQGFMRLAMRTNTPIVPFGFVGGEEMCRSFSRMKPLARLMGAPYVPLTPTIVPLPLPAKVHITFGEPMRFEGSGDEDDDVVLPNVRRVEEAVKSLIDQGLERRTGVFFG
ncbi:MAG: acyltransferase family protein [Deltaproteobacteria bacterium]|nr:acyltransferase family protein [Deltaproteobacteria bacterium]